MEILFAEAPQTAYYNAAHVYNDSTNPRSLNLSELGAGRHTQYNTHVA